MKSLYLYLNNQSVEVNIVLHPHLITVFMRDTLVSNVIVIYHIPNMLFSYKSVYFNYYTVITARVYVWVSFPTRIKQITFKLFFKFNSVITPPLQWAERQNWWAWETEWRNFLFYKRNILTKFECMNLLQLIRLLPCFAFCIGEFKRNLS